MTDFLMTLLHLTVTGSVMVLVILLLRFIFKKRLPKMLAVVLWAAAFAAFVVPINLPAPPFLAGAYSQINTVSVIKLPAPVKIQQPKKITAQPSKKAGDVKAQPNGKTENSTATNSPIFYIFAVYCGVSVLLIAALIIFYALTINRFRAGAPLIESEMLKSLREKVKVRRKIALAVSDSTSVPVTAGIVKPKVVFPKDFDFDNERLASHIYVHELIHVKHFDNAISLAALFIAALHWFNPLAFVAYKMLCRDMELACDTAAVKFFGFNERSNYAESLLSVASGKKRRAPMLAAAFGKSDIKERVTNVMNTSKITVKILSVCAISLLVTGITFSAMACKTPTPVKASVAASVMNKKVPQKDITSAKTKKLFTSFAYNYYCENLQGPDQFMTRDYNGKINAQNANSLLYYAIDQNQSGIDLQKYTAAGDSEAYNYVIPANIGDKVIKSCFDIGTVNHSLFKSYNAKTGKYVVNAEDLASSTDYFAATVVNSVKQAGSTVIVNASYYEVKGNNNDGTPVANLNKKFQTLKFTFSVSGGKYIIEKVETVR